MVMKVPSLKVMDETGKVRELPLYDSAKPKERDVVVYMVKTLSDGVRLAFNRDYKFLGSVQAAEAEWEAALIHSLDVWAEYRLNDRVPGDAVWFEVCGESREAYRQGWIEGRDWEEGRRGDDG
jgi:hypothetical protein